MSYFYSNLHLHLENNLLKTNIIKKSISLHDNLMKKGSKLRLGINIGKVVGSVLKHLCV